MHDYFAHSAATARTEILRGRADDHRQRTAFGRDLRSVLAAPLITAVDELCHRLAVRRDDAMHATDGFREPAHA